MIIHRKTRLALSYGVLAVSVPYFLLFFALATSFSPEMVFDGRQQWSSVLTGIAVFAPQSFVLLLISFAMFLFIRRDPEFVQLVILWLIFFIVGNIWTIFILNALNA